jgi:hypothetical protein
MALFLPLEFSRISYSLLQPNLQFLSSPGKSSLQLAGLITAPKIHMDSCVWENSDITVALAPLWKVQELTKPGFHLCIRSSKKDAF